ncbi:MAG: aspartate carbamoyltransferase, partial [Oscillospiraceae bacterium]|nr:aspartate carbamoyltransferase [Oscillospiraceae bacterium]
NMIVKLGGEYEECSYLEKVIDQLDVLYMTRIQKERFCSKKEYDAQKDIFKLDCDKMKFARKDLVVMHPLPRVDEIEDSIDYDPRAFYFKQAANGIYARMALILYIFSQQSCKNVSLSGQKLNMSCSNKRCITNTEKYLPMSFLKGNDGYICEYCDSKAK